MAISIASLKPMSPAAGKTAGASRSILGRVLLSRRTVHTQSSLLRIEPMTSLALSERIQQIK